MSSLGRVRSLPRKWCKGQILSAPCAEFTGYPSVNLCSGGGRQRTALVHQLVATAFHGARPDWADDVRHLDGSRNNNASANLAWGTTSENNHDRRTHGTDHNVNKTRCPADHPYDEGNTFVNSKGSRECRICRRDNARKNMRARRARLRDARLA